MTPSKRTFSWPKTASVNQRFSLPDTIIHYLLMNPSSSKVYIKMVKLCKYFFEKNLILIVTHMEKDFERSIFCEKKNCRPLGELCPRCVVTDINKIHGKIWLTKMFSLFVRINISNFISILRPKLFRCDITTFTMYHQIVLFDDFKFMISSVKSINLHKVKIIYADENPVMFETILEALPNVKIFFFKFHKDFPNASVSTFDNVNKLKNLGRLESFNLYKAPEVINIKDLSTFITNHKNSRICLEFSHNISENYQKQLDGLVDTVIESNIPNRLLQYRGCDEEKRKILDSRWDYGEDDDDCEKCARCG